MRPPFSAVSGFAAAAASLIQVAVSLPLALVVTPVVLSILHDGEFKKKLPFRQQIGIRDL